MSEATLPASANRDKVTVLSIAPLFGEAIKRIHRGESVGALFSSEVQLVEEMTFWGSHAEDEEPEDPIARHMLAACTGRDVPARASNGFVEATFDSFASSFEAKLAILSYRAPALVAAMVEDSPAAAAQG